ncbi:hypothetical protein KFK09_009238 [Dendrobium nobile]|uniref:Reverse transcriptase Ty1/copia-type domain-containing protein n=1 Tax=Dendrobium nobile TaxID=94219 RepID=A0A8T3BMT9_DENNO|nr:hypothetical protein KFK09_009238 [Dendrobium nobile]
MVYRKGEVQIYVLIYVDDLLITGSHSDIIQQLLQLLQQHFPPKQLGPVSNFLGIQVSTTAAGTFLHQAQYAAELVHAANLQHSKPVQKPISLKPSTSSDSSSPFFDPHHYRQLAGSLNYLTITMPDIAYAAHKVCQHMHSPTTADYMAIKHLLRYINGTLQFGLPLTTAALQLRSYSDADWAGDSSDKKSTTSFCTFLGTTQISWSVKKQITVAKSSTEAEYRSLSSATSDIIWIRCLLTDFQLSPPTLTPLYCDNTSAMAIAHNPVFHARTKHIEIDYQFVRHHINNGEITLHHIHSEDQPADLLTKSLSSSRFQDLRFKLGIRSIHA